MIKHIVSFTLSGFSSSENAEQQLAIIKKELEKLPALIPSLDDMKVHSNVNPKEECGFVLIASLSQWDDIEKYAQHPAHLDVVKKHIAPYKKGRICIDFEE